jgi:hypothetical protein
MRAGLAWLSNSWSLKHCLQVNLGILKRRGKLPSPSQRTACPSANHPTRRTEAPAATLRSWEDRYYTGAATGLSAIPGYATMGYALGQVRRAWLAARAGGIGAAFAGCLLA